jgi:hypothetical protein
MALVLGSGSVISEPIKGKYFPNVGSNWTNLDLFGTHGRKIGMRDSAI